jgi:hypothetical protein
MKILTTTLFALTLLCCSAMKSEGRFLTIMMTTNTTNQITIESYETVKVHTYYDPPGLFSRLRILKDDGNLIVFPGYVASAYQPVSPSFGTSLVVAGPATLIFENLAAPRQLMSPAILTLEITPDAYPPDKAITLGPGPGGAAISLETSTNLLNWTSATNGVYTNLNDATFFRIRAAKVP